MILPQNIQEKLNIILKDNKLSTLKDVQKSLTQKYKTQSGRGTSLIDSKQDGLLYALSRMPATYSVILTLLNQLREQNLINEIKTAADYGCGTGAGYFALKEFDEKINVSLFERDKNMINVFDEFKTGEKVCKFDLIKDEILCNADLVMTSYVLSELSDETRIAAAKKLFRAADKYLLIIDTGTPKVWQQMMQIKDALVADGAKVAAPCQSQKCSLVDDYCQFFARVERTAAHRQVKDAKLSYEDEKYFYLLFSKQEQTKASNFRVVRRPSFRPNTVSLVLCGANGVETVEITKKHKEKYKIAKKIKINDMFD